MGSSRKKRARAKKKRSREAMPRPKPTPAPVDATARGQEAPAAASPPGTGSTWAERGLLFLGFLLLSLALYGRALSGGFLHWDDYAFLKDNPTVHQLSLGNLSTLLTTLHQQVYTPLHFLASALQWTLWGAWAPGYHFVSIAVFALGLTCLFRVLERIGLPTAAALVATAVYAAHPSHVESVAWVTGLKDVLSFAFGMAAVLFHLEGPGGRRRPALSFALFVAAVLSKNTLIVLPALLVLLDWVCCGTRLRTALLRVAPHLGLGLVLTFVVHGRWQAKEIMRKDATSLAARVGESYWHYLRTTLVPYDLSPLYPARVPRGWTGGAVAGLVVVLLLGALCAVRRWWWALAALAWFLLALAPMTNAVPLYYRVNDRYLILPTVSLALLAAHWLAPHLRASPAVVNAHREPRRLLGAFRGSLTTGRARVALGAALAVGVVWGALTIRLTGAWTSDERLWTLATHRQPSSYYAWLKLGEARGRKGRHAEAMDAYANALRIVSLPSGYLKLFDAALQHDLPAGRKAPAYKPLLGSYVRVMARPPKLLALATVLEKRRLFRTAWAALFTAQRLAPKDGEVRLRLASNWLKRRQPARALKELGRAPDSDDLRRRYLTYKIIALQGLGKQSKAASLLAEALRRYPDDPVLQRLSKGR